MRTLRLWCFIDGSFLQRRKKFRVFPRKYHLENRTRTCFPVRNRREVAAGVKSGCVRKVDRTGKLAKTTHKLLTERATKGGTGRSDESADLSPGGTYGKGRPANFDPSFDPTTREISRISTLTTPGNIGPSRDFDRPGRRTITWSDYVGYSLSSLCLVGTPPTEVHDRKVRDARKSNVVSSSRDV